jgi:hypothetical protein
MTRIRNLFRRLRRRPALLPGQEPVFVLPPGVRDMWAAEILREAEASLIFEQRHGKGGSGG